MKAQRQVAAHRALAAQAAGCSKMLGLIGSATAAFKRAHIAIDLRIVDTNTSRIVAAKSVEGRATNVDMSAAPFGASGSGGFGVPSAFGRKRRPKKPSGS